MRGGKTYLPFGLEEVASFLGFLSSFCGFC